MTSCKALAALLALAGMTLPVLGHAAADDVASLRAELQALQNDYKTRVDALEQRITQLESAPVGGLSEPTPDAQPMPAPGSSGNTATAFNPVDFTDPRRQLHEHFAGSRNLAHRRFHPERR